MNTTESNNQASDMDSTEKMNQALDDPIEGTDINIISVT